MRGKVTRLSIIIVNYNTCDLLRGCLVSIPKDEVQGCEVIVVDNASQDDSSATVLREFPWVKLIASPVNGGFSKGNNLGIRSAQGEYVLLLNSDTVVRADALRSKVRFFEEHPEAGGVVGPLLNADGSQQATVTFKRTPGLIDLMYRLSGISRWVRGNERARRFLRKYAGFVIGRTARSYLDGWAACDVAMEVEGISGACMMLRRDAVDAIGPLDENIFMYLEDVDYCIRLRKAGWKLFYVPGGAVVHLVGKSSGGRMRHYGVQSYRSLFYFFAKHHAGWRLSFARALVLTGSTCRWIGNALWGTISNDSICARNRRDLQKVIALCIQWQIPEPESIQKYC
jgi:N-acetylglucosaminyl-diphospho-decaprenol L-rhamnosyltransferase